MYPPGSPLRPRYFLFFLSPILIAACGGGDGSIDPGDEADGGGQSTVADAAADAPPVDAIAGTQCLSKDPVVQIGFTCNFVWSQCTAGSEFAIDCRIQNVAGNVFSLCDCLENGASTGQFISTEVCDQSEWPAVEAIVNPECNWDLI